MVQGWKKIGKKQLLVTVLEKKTKSLQKHNIKIS